MNLKSYIVEQLRSQLDDLKESAGDFVYEFDIAEGDDVAYAEFEDEWASTCEEVDDILLDLKIA